MARAFFVVGFVTGAAAVVFGFAALGLHADEPSRDVHEAAAAAGYDELELAGAINSVGVDPWTYARWEGRLPPLSKPTEGLKETPPGLSKRVACIEAKESGGANIANRRGSGAVGVLQFMPSTFAAHAAEMGHPEWSPWNVEQARAVAAHDLALGRRAQWVVSGC